jgi:hypothetical protein
MRLRQAAIGLCEHPRETRLETDRAAKRWRPPTNKNSTNSKNQNVFN